MEIRQVQTMVRNQGCRVGTPTHRLVKEAIGRSRVVHLTWAMVTRFHHLPVVWPVAMLMNVLRQWLFQEHEQELEGSRSAGSGVWEIIFEWLSMP
ncbi:hypothetical protein OSB04_029813 [Centaurea solstitialis]|uniref:Uncharacterized protein n=1 Tax=Centaurea solstitialis TaxID=347529 RepID=A0AA38W384_9ASTR|nr:hypothetical protein OSB04_029813 [Centaurea solstitialis]